MLVVLKLHSYIYFVQSACLFERPQTELSYDSPCACRIIHEAVTLSYASIKHHLQPAGLRMTKRGGRTGWKRKDAGRK